MTILEFIHHFPDESSCENYIKERQEFAIKLVNPLQSNTGSGVVNSLNAALEGGEVL